MSNFTNRAMLGQYKISEASGVGSVSWENGIQCVLPELKVYGSSVQNGTPAQNAPVTLSSLEGNIICRGQNVEKSIALPTLRSAGKCADVYNATDGTITRNTAEVIVDGVKVVVSSVIPAGTYPQPYCTVRTGYLPTQAHDVIATHFITRYGVYNPGSIYRAVDWYIFVFWEGTPITTVAEANAWFKAQYDAGTPVKIIHGLREPITESIEPVSIIQPSGQGEIIQSGSTLNSQIDVKYLTHS